jgi:8-oxo-dGTP pyrophosphatase MutT (NUDIX family)
LNINKLRKGIFQDRMEKIASRFVWPSTSAAVLAAKDNHLLTVKIGDMYMLPGGTVEPGETLEEAAIRETREETGLNVESQGRIYELRQPGKGPLQIFGGKITGGALRKSSEGVPTMIPIDKVDKVKWRYDLDIPGMIMDLDLLE